MKRRSLIAFGATATAFADLKPANAQTTAYAVVPTLDDPQNTSGLGAPAILRGTVSTYNLAGLTKGAGMSTAIRQANATALQSAITYAASNAKFFECVPATYEIDSATGLVIPAQGFGNYGLVWRGSRTGTVIKQFYNGGTGAPVLTIGDTSGVITSEGLDIDGATLGYGVSQSGLTSSTPLVVGSCAWGKIGNLIVSDAVNPGYDAMLLSGGNNFSMTWGDIILGGAQRNMLNIRASGTQSKWTNLYLSNGGVGIYNPLTSYIALNTNVAGHFDVINCEWGAGANGLVLNSSSATCYIEISSMHLEGLKFTGAFPSLFFLAFDSLKIGSLNLVDLIIQSANFTGGTPPLFADYQAGASSVEVDALSWTNNASGQINTPFSLFGYASSFPNDDTSVFSCSSGFLQDQSATGIFAKNFQFDSHMPTSAFLGPTKWGHYDFGAAGSRVDRATIPVSATYTHYGQHQNATLQVPASITSFTLTLSNLIGATGTQNVPTGTVTHVRRQSGSASGTLTVKDDGGTTLTTNTTSGQDFWYHFNGTHYVTFTPVT
jgi:hypothetical protein